jgi:hypothetical protein
VPSARVVHLSGIVLTAGKVFCSFTLVSHGCMRHRRASSLISERLRLSSTGRSRAREPKLLCVGSDVRLLDTRLCVLSLRYVATAVTSLEELKFLAAEDLDAVVLCHSLSHSDCQTAVSIVRDKWPAARLLQITLPGAGGSLYGVDAWVGALEGPGALLRSVEELLSQEEG